MEMTTLVRIICSVVAVVLLGAIILRRKNRETEE